MKGSAADVLHIGLGALGAVFDGADLVDGGLYILEGDMQSAVDSAAAALFMAGAGPGAAKVTRKFEQILARGGEEADAVRSYVNLASDYRTRHILYGDSGKPGSYNHLFPGGDDKSVFPEGWTPDRIMHEVSDVVTDPGVTWNKNRMVGGVQRYEAIAERDGVLIKVVTDGKDIITAYPIG